MIKNKVSEKMGGSLTKITQVSKLTGISRSALTKIYYKRSSGISFDTLNALCTFFNCEIGELFEYINEDDKFE